jgi:hypothetical protein
MTIVYSAVTRFDPDCGEEWEKFIEWSGLTQLREVISLDGLLCPTVFQELTEEDWQHNVHADYKTHLFRDLDYLLHKVSEDKRMNLLAVMQEPTATDLHSFVDPHFVFRGCDLIETEGSVSALVNCGGFDKAFSNTDLSEYGLLTDHAKALSVQQLLRNEYPDEHHAECDVWAIWQKML